MAIDDNTTYGLTGAQVKDLASKVNNLKTNAGAPTTATVGTVGQLLADTTNGKLYQCTAVTPQGTTPETYTYTWEPVGEDGKSTLFYFDANDSMTTVTSPVTLYKDKTLSQTVTKAEFMEAAKNGEIILVCVYVDDQSSPIEYYNWQYYPLIFNEDDSMTETFSSIHFIIWSWSGPIGLSWDNTTTPVVTEVINIPNVVQTAGTSTTNVMSQDAASKLVYASPNPSHQKTIKIGKSASATESHASVAIGQEATASGQWAVALGYLSSAAAYSVAAGMQSSASGQYAEAIGRQASAGYNGSIALGAYSYASSVGEMNIGVGSATSYGYNNTAYRLLSGVHDGQSAHDAATKGQLDGRIITNAGAPTTSTAGTKGQILEDTTNGKLYICTDATNPYVWEEVGVGGGGLTTLSYGNSTWNDFLTAYNAGKIVYCRASSAADPSSGAQTRMAFMAYINNPTTPTEVEFQYVRSVSSKTAAQPCDQVFVYKLTSAGGGTWTVATRDMTYKVAAGTNVTTSYSNGTVTINADAPVITMQSTDPGEGAALAANNFIAVYDAS